MQQSLRIHWWSKRREHRRTSIDDAMRESQCEASIDRSTSQKTEFTETIVDTIHREFGSHRPPGVPTPTASSLMFPSPPDFFTFLSFGVGWCVEDEVRRSSFQQVIVLIVECSGYSSLAMLLEMAVEKGACSVVGYASMLHTMIF